MSLPPIVGDWWGRMRQIFRTGRFFLFCVTPINLTNAWAAMEAYFSILVQNNRFVTLINIESQGDLKWQKIISHQRHT